MAPAASSIRLVLVAPRTPGNVGACARVAANFGITDWVIVSPQCSWDGWDARKLATGTAGDRLDRIRVVSTVAEAVRDCQVAVGFSRRAGKVRVPTLSLEEALGLRPYKLALVFGNEETGLTREELEPCTHLCSIPTAAELPSMNLSHAVAVVLARFYEATAGGKKARASRRAGSPARLSELQGLLTHWREFLEDVGLTGAGNPDRILVSLRAVFERAALSAQEIRALRGVLSKSQVRLGSRRRGKRVPGYSAWPAPR